IDDKERQYMSLIENDLQPFYPKFVTAFTSQSPVEREIGRCAVVEFGSSSDRHQTMHFINSTNLHDYLSDSDIDTVCTHAPADSPPRRRLFILEDLPANHTLALGSRLRIPPSFFARQWNDPASPTFNHRDIFKRSSSSQFLLRYATSNPVTISAQAHTQTNVYVFDTNVCRYLHTYKPDGLVYDEPRSHHTLSFWSSSIKVNGSWDAVLLVDPPPTRYVKCVPSGERVPIQHGAGVDSRITRLFLNPELELLQELPRDTSQWSRYRSMPQYVSLFDDTLLMITSESQHPVDKPIDAVEIPRRLIISTLMAFLRRRYLNLLAVQRSHLRPHHAMRHDYLYNFSEGYMSKWHDEFYNFVVGTISAMREFAREIEDNVVALNIRPSRKRPDAGRPPQWESDGWKSIQDLTQLVDSMINSLATSYLQYISIQEARVSNANAQSLSKITVLTMLFIPLSTVASIFSMGGDFLPGEKRAWVFWVVATPVLLGLAWLY
ncbi:hypothetical protein K491DRAFT_550880, partial [Lophiostoma macrostomum CBS 122681]